MAKNIFWILSFYPAIAAATYLIDRILFVVVASPLLLCLTIPKTRFSDKDYEVREQIVLMGPTRLQLVKKGLIIETVLGNCNDEDVVYLPISSMKIISQAEDTTRAIITSKNKLFEMMFTK